MKKFYILLIVSALFLVTLVACTADDPSVGTDAGTTPVTQASADTTTDAATEAPMAESTEAPVVESTDESVEESAKESTEEPTAALDSESTEASSEEFTEEQPTEEPAETPTEPATDAPSEPTVEITDGMMLYYEDFSSYGDIADLDSTVAALGWIIQTTANDYAYSDWTAGLAIQNGQLVVTNFDSAAGFKGSDSYALMLGEDYMKPITEYGDYTIQYDVTYTDASNYKRYICLLTDYYGDAYNSFHFRIGGYANNQAHLMNEWYTFDVVDPTQDLSAKLTENDPEKGTTIAYKLLGIETPIKDASAIENFRNVTVTIRIRHDNDLGNIIYMKTAEMENFVCVSMPSPDAADADVWDLVNGTPALAFKVGGAINGTMDNIMMWAGLGEMPADTTVTYPLAK